VSPFLSFAMIAQRNSSPNKPLQSIVDESTFSRFARTTPKAQATGNPSSDHQALIQRTTFMKIINRLESNPDQLLNTWALLESITDFRALRGWDKTQEVVAQLPKHWKAQWFVSNDSSTKPLSQQFLDNADAQTIHQMFNLFTMTSPNTRLPIAARADKAVCKNMFTRRLLAVGNPLLDWASKHINSNGIVDWQKGGAYVLKFGEDNKAVEVSFFRSVAPITVEISRDFEIVDNWDPWKAHAVKKPDKYFFFEFFDSVSGPNQFKLDNKKNILRDVICDQENFCGDAKNNVRKKALKAAEVRLRRSRNRVRTKWRQEN
jgi:hypothetical protein